ncbi:MAG: DUF2268 domain-containing putative Zn-dependent protease [Candidatus Pacearchaeota archaeon]
MKKEIIKNDENTLAELYLFLDKSNRLPSKKFAKEASKDCPNTDSGFAGWKEKEALEFHLNFVNNDAEKQFPNEGNMETKISDSVRKTLRKIKDSIPMESLNIFIFPTTSKFVKDKLDGISGFCTFKKTIILHMFPSENWEESMKKSLIHEATHALSPFYNINEMSIGEQIIFDGIAENFVEHITGEKSHLGNAINKESAQKYFEELKEILDSEDFEEHGKVFYGTGKYPLWTGYSIGYHLIKEYLKKVDLTWDEIIKKDPKEILKEILITNPST